MISVEAIHISPVKSLALACPDTVHVTGQGITEDRRLFLIDDRGRLLTQRQVGRLVQITAEYRTDSEWLTLRMPDGDVVEGPVEPGEKIVTRHFGRNVVGQAVPGDWAGVLSGFCGVPVKLVKTEQPGQCYDEYPI